MPKCKYLTNYFLFDKLAVGFFSCKDVMEGVMSVSNKNRDFKKLLAAICGVASALGGNAASAKGSKGKPADSTKNLAVNKEGGVLDYVKKNPVKSGVIVGGGVAFTVSSILGVRYLLKDKEKPDDGSGGGNPQKSQDNPQDDSQKENPGQKKTNTNPPQGQKHDVYDFAFDQVKIQNFQKRELLNIGDGNGQMANTTENDVKRDLAFFSMLKKAGIQGLDLQTKNYAAFTSNDKDHSKTIYVVNAPAGSVIRNNFVTAASRTKDFQMLRDDVNFPDLLFFFGQRRKSFFGGTDLGLLSHTFDWGNQGTIRFFVGEEAKAPELQ